MHLIKTNPHHDLYESPGRTFAMTSTSCASTAPLSPPAPIRCKSESIEVIMPAAYMSSYHSPRSTMDVFVLTDDDQIHRVRSDLDESVVSYNYLSSCDDDASCTASLALSLNSSAFFLDSYSSLKPAVPVPPGPPPIPSLIVDITPMPAMTSEATLEDCKTDDLDYTYSDDDDDDDDDDYNQTEYDPGSCKLIEDESEEEEQLIGLGCLPESFWGCVFLGDGGPEPFWDRGSWNSNKTWTIR